MKKFWNFVRTLFASEPASAANVVKPGSADDRDDYLGH